ncbi:Mitochondrial translocator assembly and maintenance protein 41 [Serendipita sp. 411]|nr:Mitochondrial translocator assembly and maintenance protein 41 [Serendipita sp. 411]
MIHAARRSARFVRCLSTETASSPSPDPSHLPPQPRPQARQQPRSSLTPRKAEPASSSSSTSSTISSNSSTPLRLPRDFGRNQLLSVPNSTRALLEEIVATFKSPIRYAFAYGSGVFEQEGSSLVKDKKPMLDFIFAVSHPEHWHSINLAQNPSHYALHARVLGSDFVGRVQNWGPAAVWFNPFVPVCDVNIKYGVISVDNLCTDLLTWNSLYVAGRMHKPLRIIKDDARVRLTQQVNLTSAIRTALLTLPETFDERQLFERITALSYSGDPRMALPFENRSKISNIVNAQTLQFRELYHRLVVGLPGVEWAEGSNVIKQDASPQTRASHLRKLPSELRNRIDVRFAVKAGIPSKESDEAGYWSRVAGDPSLPKAIQSGWCFSSPHLRSPLADLKLSKLSEVDSIDL